MQAEDKAGNEKKEEERETEEELERPCRTIWWRKKKEKVVRGCRGEWRLTSGTATQFKHGKSC